MFGGKPQYRFSLQLPDTVSPFKGDSSEYHERCLNYNNKLINTFSSALQAVFEDFERERFLVNAVGSDARYEKGPVSPLELAVYVENDEMIDKVKPRLTYYADNLSSAKVLDEKIEWRNIEKTKPARMPHTEGKGLLSPNRIFDGLPLHGDYQLRKKQLQLLGEESRTSRGGKYLHSLKKKVSEYQDITDTGKQTFRSMRLTHFNADSGKLYYDDTYRWSVKTGPLRSLQFALARDKYRMMRDGMSPQLLGQLNRNTVNQLDDLKTVAEPTVDTKTVSSLQDHYKFFLQSYHQSQREHRINDNQSFTKDAETLKRRLQDMHSIIDVTRGKDAPHYFFTYD